MSRKTTAEKFSDEVYDITVTGRHVQVTDAMKQYAIDKISKIERFSNRLIDVNAVMDIQKLMHRIDIIMLVDSIVIRSTASSDNMYASIDKAVDRLTAQLRRYKQRINEHHAKDVTAVSMNVQVLKPLYQQELDEVNDDILSQNAVDLFDSYAPHRIVSQESRPLKTLNYGEAEMKMDLSRDAFMIFRAEEDKKLKVIYRRNDGNYGVIEPE